MSLVEHSGHPVVARRVARGWSQAELARRASLPRTSVSAIEGERLTPSVTAAIALARALECSVEELFGGGADVVASAPQWASTPRGASCRFWEAQVGARRMLFPVEALSVNVVAHDGVWREGLPLDAGNPNADRTLMLASCDPAAGLLAAEYARSTGFRMIILPRGGGEALDLMKRGLIHAAGVHRSTPEEPQRNVETVRSVAGRGFRLLRAAEWEEGLAVSPDNSTRSTRSVVRNSRTWALREAGSAARECLDELRADAGGRVVRSHTAVAEAVRGGWADAGVCVRLAAEEAGLNFLPVRTEMLDLCFADSHARDPRILALIGLLRSRSHRRLISELPGYSARETGGVVKV